MTLKHRFFLLQVFHKILYFCICCSVYFVLILLSFAIFFSFVVISFFTFILQAFRDVRNICKLVFFFSSLNLKYYLNSQ